MKRIEYEFGEAYSDGEAVRFYIGTKARPDQWAVVDMVDWPTVKDRKWHGRPRGLGIYVYHKGAGYLHRALMKPPKGLSVDHVDGDPTNNRRSNLRICTHAENMRFGVDRRRGYSVVKIIGTRSTKQHVVKAKLADGTIKEYVYPTRAKKRTLKQQTVKRGEDYKMTIETQKNNV